MPRRILVVHDDPAVGQVLSRALREAGYEVGAEQGLGPSNGTEPSWDLVVTNFHGGGPAGPHGGLELRHRFPRIPILHLDELAHSDHPRRPDDGPNGYHPFSVARLLGAVAQRLGDGAQ